MPQPVPHWRWKKEISGAVGDLGITIPLAYALVVTAGFPPGRIFFLWGTAYVLTGLFYRVPVSIQPLKAMAVIVISGTVSPSVLTTAAVGYGILFLLLAVTGVVPLIRKAFSEPLVRGVQLGIGLMLARKAWGLVSGHPFLLRGSEVPGWISWVAVLLIVVLLVLPRLRSRPGIVLGVLAAGLASGVILGRGEVAAGPPGGVIAWTPPQWHLLGPAFFLLMLPQLPLTLGNAVIAEEDVCRISFGERAGRVTVARLAGSIGLLDVAMGLLGGFPVCHGAGGSMAHARFGGRTGRTTILLGGIYVLLAVIPSGADFLFLIPVPLLGALLLGVSWGMIRLVALLPDLQQTAIAVTVGLVGFFVRNLAIALAVGWVLQMLLNHWRRSREPVS